MSSLKAPASVTNMKQLADWAIGVNGGTKLPKDQWQAVKAANPGLPSTRKKKATKKKAPAKKRARKQNYGGGGGFKAFGGGGRPIVTYPNISGYGGYELSGYATADFGDVFKGGIQG